MKEKLAERMMKHVHDFVVVSATPIAEVETLGESDTNTNEGTEGLLQVERSAFCIIRDGRKKRF